MAKLEPNIILRANLVHPKSVPSAFAVIFERLVNHILPRLGFRIGVEYFKTGWVLFLGNISDFRDFFGRPMFSKSHVVPTGAANDDDGPFIWDFKFERLPPHPPEESFASILKKFYSVPGALGAGAFQEISSVGMGKRYRISYPSLAAYQSSLEELVKQAHNMLTSMRGDQKAKLKEGADVKNNVD